MSTQYLKFRGYNVTSQLDEEFLPDPQGGEGLVLAKNSYGIENTRNLVVKKEDIVNIYSYIPENAELIDPSSEQACVYCRGCLSFRVNLALKNMGLAELQIVSEVPVNNVERGGPNDLVLLETAADRRALTIPFESWLLNNDNGYGCFNAPESPYGCKNGDTNSPAPGIPVVPPINGIQYQWTENAIKAYFGVFDDAPWSFDGTSPAELISRWLEEKVSKYLIANPGAPITEVALGEVKDFVYEGVTYGGFKLRFGGIGMPCVTEIETPFSDPATEEFVLNQKAFSNSLPFRYSDRRIGSTVGGNIPEIPEP